ncbi:YicC/YloC family endoribonuclease [Thalassospira marina]|uniref:YicC family protein n=1 Tax=Thalassospira marina TaxID=2048283 RepID=A0A2N3KXW8_9PROT|nr:YicC/YloC family endoribonuclease [Thalassospira marina]AUG53321.1 YicC family protein [Thalassospira marina]PKR55340.1 YicC family protein [Thalassospira marina]
MTVSSMTGFGRAEGAGEGFAWVWELRSVNGKGLDVRARLNGAERLEAPVRDAVSKAFKRGNIGVTLNVTRPGENTSYRINRDLLADLVRLAEEFDNSSKLAAGTIADLLNVRGVLEAVEQTEDDASREAREGAMMATLDTAIAQLAENRDAEGVKLQELLQGHIERIEQTVVKAESCAGARAEAIRARLQRQIGEVMEAGQFDADRLHQEAALLATKVDVREEIDRLKAHIAAARTMIGKGGAIGRKLDFLCQEFNREANTLCSKANDIELTGCGMDLKVIIDQLREQVQNVE